MMLYVKFFKNIFSKATLYKTFGHKFNGGIPANGLQIIHAT